MAKLLVIHKEICANSADEHKQLGSCFSCSVKYPFLILEIAERIKQLDSCLLYSVKYPL